MKKGELSIGGYTEPYTDEELWCIGVIRRTGRRDNMSDCEVDNWFIHIPSGEKKRFHGTDWDRSYQPPINEWCDQFEAVDISGMGRAIYDAFTLRL